MNVNVEEEAVVEVVLVEVVLLNLRIVNRMDRIITRGPGTGTIGSTICMKTMERRMIEESTIVMWSLVRW